MKNSQNSRTLGPSLLLEHSDLSDNFQMLGHFLQHSPNLEKLTLDHCKVYCALALNL